MALNESWHIRSRGRECAATQRPFVTGEPIVTALFPDPESSGYLRRDYGLEAWQARGADEEPPFSSWRTIYAPSGGDKAAAREKENPEDILRRLVEEDADHTENTRYILAVMLERQKLLRETDSQRTPTGILRVYEHRKTGEVFIVKDPDIALSDIVPGTAEKGLAPSLENDGHIFRKRVQVHGIGLAQPVIDDLAAGEG